MLIFKKGEHDSIYKFTQNLTFLLTKTQCLITQSVFLIKCELKLEIITILSNIFFFRS